MVTKEITSVVVTIGVTLLLFSLGAMLRVSTPNAIARLIAFPAVIILVTGVLSILGTCIYLWLKSRKARVLGQPALARRTIMLRPIDKDYELNRNEMTNWFQRLTQMYHFTLLVVAALLGFGFSILKENNIPPIVFAAIFTLVAFVSTAGMALIARTYSIIFRQGSYLRVFYETQLWIASNRSQWDYHKQHAPIELQWVRGQNEPRYIAAALAGLIVAAGFLLMFRLLNPETWSNLNSLDVFLGSIPVWLGLAAFAVWFSRLWTIPDHPKMWEQHWRSWYDEQG